MADLNKMVEELINIREIQIKNMVLLFLANRSTPVSR